MFWRRIVAAFENKLSYKKTKRYRSKVYINSKYDFFLKVQMWHLRPVKGGFKGRHNIKGYNKLKT